MVLLLDDVHHFDTASWRLLAAVGAAAPGALLIAIALRPQASLPDTAGAVAAPESVAACVRQCRKALLSRPGAVSAALKPFDAAETEQYMAQALSDAALPGKQVTLSPTHQTWLEHVVVAWSILPSSCMSSDMGECLCISTDEADPCPRAVQLSLLAAAVFETTAGLPLYVDQMVAHLLVQVPDPRKLVADLRAECPEAMARTRLHVLTPSRCSQALRHRR